MSVENWEYITYDERLFRGRLETPLSDLGTEQRFERGVETTGAVLESFQQMIRPTDCSYRIVDSTTNEHHEENLISKDGMTHSDLIDSIRRTAERFESPQLLSFNISGSVRITLSDGVRYIPDCNDDSVVRPVNGDSKTPMSPLEVHLNQTKVHRPCRTEVIDIIGNSKHWLDGDSEKFYLPEATPLAKIDQSRLETALSGLYDTIEPVELSFDMFENTNGWLTPRATVPGCESLQVRHAVEWVLENFYQQRAEGTIEFEYIGEEWDSNINRELWNNPDERFDVFLRKAIPKDRYSAGTIATVQYPNSCTIFQKNKNNRWEIDSD